MSEEKLEALKSLREFKLKLLKLSKIPFDLQQVLDDVEAYIWII